MPRLCKFDLLRVERLIKDIISDQLRYINLLGAVLGDWWVYSCRFSTPLSPACIDGYPSRKGACPCNSRLAIFSISLRRCLRAERNFIG